MMMVLLLVVISNGGGVVSVGIVGDGGSIVGGRGGEQ